MRLLLTRMVELTGWIFLYFSDKFQLKYDKDINLDFEYDYAMMQKVLLKYVYNDLRANK